MSVKELVAKRKNIDSKNYLLIVTICLFIVMYIAGIVIYSDKGFGKMQTFLNMLIDNAGLLIAASGMTLVMIAGGIDISVGSMVCLVCMILSYSMERLGSPSLVACAAVLLLGVLFGALHGWLISYMKLQPFIVTLAGLFFYRGIAAVISSDQISIKINKTFLAIAENKINIFLGSTVNKHGVRMYPYVHPTVVIALITVAIIWFILKYTRFGRNLFAIGGNEQSALF